MATYRIRWPVVLMEAGPPALLGAVVVAVLIRPVVIGVGLGLVLGAALGAVIVRRVRRRWLAVTADGLEVQRDKYGLQVSWDSITGIDARKGLGLLRPDQIVASVSTPIARTSTGTSRPVPSRLATHPAATRIQVGFYDKNWRHGPIGDELRRRGIIPTIR